VQRDTIEKVQFVPVVRETETQAYVVLELGEKLPGVESGEISFHLPESASYEEAQAVARYLRDHVQSIGWCRR
jgi:hypothetical protein